MGAAAGRQGPLSWAQGSLEPTKPPRKAENPSRHTKRISTFQSQSHKLGAGPVVRLRALLAEPPLMP